MNNSKKISLRFQYNLMLKTFTMLVTFTGIFTQQVLGQASDNFSDGDLTLNPAWSGSVADFTVNASHQLQLNATGAGTSHLSVPFSFTPQENVQWEFYARQTLAGSASNFSRIYLASSQQDLTGPLNGYYLQLGEAGSNDAVELFRQSGSASISVCRATQAQIANAVNARIRVTRSYAGAWSVLIDYAGSTNFVPQATGVDNTHTSASFFGIRCTYTVTNTTRFFYDDFSITSTPVPDSFPPEISTVNVHSATTVDLQFSEPLHRSTAEDEQNYLLSGTNTNPVSATLQADGRTVRLVFEAPFRNGHAQELSVRNVEDLAGNTMTGANTRFVFFQPVPAGSKDILFTEIFADPGPPVALPEAEFMEIHNRSAEPFDLSGWHITDGSTTGNLSAHILLPGEYLILSSTGAMSSFSPFGKVMGVSPFPSLNNSGDTLVLRDARGITIDSVNYTAAWYNDNEKKDGGYTLELIDPENLCAEAGNWTASEDEGGGTPGTQNSVFAGKPDLTGPKLLSVFPVSETVLLLQFDEKLEKRLPPTDHFLVTPSHPLLDVSFASPVLTSVHLSLSGKLQGGVRYRLTAKDIYDCAGNTLQPEFSSATFALPERADSADMVISEILFNPRPTGVDFVEIFNRSAKFINLKHWKLGNLENGAIVNEKLVFENDFLLAPQTWLVLTADGNILKGEYLRSKEETFVHVPMPSFPDDEGSVALADEEGKIIDAFSYTDKLHSVFIKEDEGVSLERISMQQPAGDAQNWKSASAGAGFATPGYLNSNARTEGVTDEAVSITPEIFVPLTGSPDFTQIRYNFDHGGWIANIRIFDAQGREIKQIANNELLGTEGSFRWDGDLNNGTKARIGAYMVWVEVFNASGAVKTFRKRVVVAGEF